MNDRLLAAAAAAIGFMATLGISAWRNDGPMVGLGHANRGGAAAKYKGEGGHQPRTPSGRTWRDKRTSKPT